METFFFKNADFLNNICIKKTRVEFHEWYAERENEGEIVTRSLVFHDIFYRIGCEVRRIYRFRVNEDIKHVLLKPERELIARWENVPEINFVYTDKERRLSNNLRLTSEDRFHWNVFYTNMGEELMVGTRKAMLDADPDNAIAQVIGNKIEDFSLMNRLWEMQKKYEEDRKNYKKNMQ
jgi:hypothetical protein